ncbi:hypothetical protein [Variovorax sp. YR752]|uniref:hypothetical protein n=1 Tax=Variovorax sp. YR752 TaxID=1884383 RepID=UPI0031383370
MPSETLPTDPLRWLPFLTPAVQFLTACIAGFIAYKFGSIQASISRQQADTARQQAATAAAAARVAQNKLKSDLFERRLAMYNHVYEYIDTVLRDKVIDHAKDSVFLISVRPLGWLTDETVTQFVFKELRAQMIELSRLSRQREVTATGPERLALANLQEEASHKLFSLHERLAKVFEPFMRLAP